MRKYYIYILTSQKRGTLCIGMTNSIQRRIAQHKEKTHPGFTLTYNVTRFVYFEQFEEVSDAIAREKQIKGWTRKKRMALIESVNPDWNEL